MIRTALLTTALGILFPGSLLATPPKVDRSIHREPAYQSKSPKYGLLVFGSEGKDRVWLVLDGDTLYVDRNGNGDLTEPGERVSPDKTPGRESAEEGYSFSVGNVNIGDRTYKHLTVAFVPLKLYANTALGKRADVQAALKKDANALAAYVTVDVAMPGLKFEEPTALASFSAGAIDLGGVLQFAATPAEAPVIHCGGPLQITFYGELPTLRVGQASDLVLVVGTPGVGPGTFAKLGYEDVIPKNAMPMAEMMIPIAKAGAHPVKEIFELKDRC